MLKIYNKNSSFNLIDEIFYSDKAIKQIYKGNTLIWNLNSLTPIVPTYTFPEDPNNPGTPLFPTEGSSYYLLVGMDNYKNSYLSYSSGHEASVDIIDNILRNYIGVDASNIHILKGSNTTIQNVSNEIAKGINYDFFFFFINTHGGAYLQDKSNDENEYDFSGQNKYDGKFGLYDGFMIDDTFWNLIKNGKRVFNIFCTCHSGTMFRARKEENTVSNTVLNFGESLKKYYNSSSSLKSTIKKDPSTYNETSLKLINWSACTDFQVSYRNAKGHFFAQGLETLFNNIPNLNEKSYRYIQDIINCTIVDKSTLASLSQFSSFTADQIKSLSNAIKNFHIYDSTPTFNHLGNVTDFYNLNIFT